MLNVEHEHVSVARRVCMTSDNRNYTVCQTPRQPTCYSLFLFSPIHACVLDDNGTT